MGISRRNQRLDLFRCIAVYSVIFLHVPFPGRIGVAINCLARFAVPLFFLSAGYFSWGKPAEVLLRRAKHCLGLLVLAAVPPAGIDLALALGRGETVGEFFRQILQPEGLLRLLQVQVLPFTYAAPLWFLAALAMTYGIWWGLTAAFRGRDLPCSLLACAALLVLALHLSLGEGRMLRGMDPVNFLWLRNVWMDGLPFFALGVWMGSRKTWMKQALRPELLYVLMALGCGLALVERSATGYLDLHFGSVVAAAAAMAAAVVRPELKHSGSLMRLLVRGGDATFPVYVLHVPVYGVLSKAEGIPLAEWIVAQKALLPLVVAGITTLLSAGLLGIRRWRERQLPQPARRTERTKGRR